MFASTKCGVEVFSWKNWGNCSAESVLTARKLSSLLAHKHSVVISVGVLEEIVLKLSVQKEKAHKRGKMESLAEQIDLFFHTCQYYSSVELR